MRRDEIWTVIGGASLALLLWIGIAGLIWTEQAEGGLRIAHLGQTLAGGIAGQTDRGLGTADRLLRIVAERAAHAGANGFDLDAFDLKAFDAETHLTDTLLPLFVIADAEGRVVQSTLPGQVRGADIADREHFRVHAEHRTTGLFISTPVLGRVSGHRTILLTRAIARPDGGFGGVVIASIESAVLQNIYAGLDLGPAGMVALIGEDSRVRIRSIAAGAPMAPDTPGMMGPHATDADPGDPQEDDLRGSKLLDFALSGTAEPISLEDAPAVGAGPPVRRLYLARHLANYPLIALIGLDERLVGRALFRETVFLVTLGLTVTALIGVFILVICQRLRRQATAEALLREAIEGMPDGFILFDPQDRLITWNRRYEAIFPHLKPILRPGIRFAEIAGYAAHFITGSEEDSVRETWTKWRIDRHLSREPTFNQALDDGRILETAERNTSDGGIVSVTRDITVLRHGEATLAASEARFSRFRAACRRLVLGDRCAASLYFRFGTCRAIAYRGGDAAAPRPPGREQYGAAGRADATGPVPQPGADRAG
ncbi:MAG: PAS-domain containing protein [Aliidongia sp.]